MKKLLLLCKIIFLFSVGFVFPVQEDPSTENDSLVQKIADINMQTFPWSEEQVDIDDWVEFIEFTSNRILNPTPKAKRRLAFQLLQSAEKNKKLQKNQIVDMSSCWSGLDLFAGKSNKEKFVANQIDRTSTEIGKVMFYYLLAHPTLDTNLLLTRQKILSFLINENNLIKKIDDALLDFKKSENVMLAFWGEACFKNATERNFFSFPGTDLLNNSDVALLLKSLYDHQGRILGFSLSLMASAALVAYGVSSLMDKQLPEKIENFTNDYKGAASPMIPLLWKIDNKYWRSGVAITGGMLCALNAKKDWGWVYGCLLIEKKLQELLIYISQSFYSLKTLYDILKLNPILAEFDEFHALIDLFEGDMEESKELVSLCDLLNSETFRDESTWFAHKGRILRAYKNMLEVRKKLQYAVCSLGFIDAYVSVAKLVKEHEHKNCKFSFPKYVHNDRPFINVTNFWNPILNPDSVILNSIKLGVENQRQNGIVTGPNEAGKSTILKALTLCLLMAQSLAVAPVDGMQFTPFSSISTYANITDDIGQGNSLFKSEVLRAQQLIDEIMKMQKDKFCFSVFDEIFNGTSPIEGSAAAYSIAKLLGRFDNSICMISTHFSLLTKLEKDTNSFSNYKISVIKNEDGTILYPYRLEKGISNQHIAFDILQREGFSSFVIEDAKNVMKEIVVN